MNAEAALKKSWAVEKDTVKLFKFGFLCDLILSVSSNFLFLMIEEKKINTTLDEPIQFVTEMFGKPTSIHLFLRESRRCLLAYFRGTVITDSPAQLLLEVHHVLVALCVVRRLGLHKVIQTAKMVCLRIHKEGCEGRALNV